MKALGKSGELIAFFPASVGSDEKPTPSGVLKVTSIDARPNYRYNPDYKFKGVKSREAFTIKPGPNNPAGSHWIGLSVGRIWHSRHAEPVEGQQVGIARLRAPHQLGRRQAGEAAEEGHRGRIYRARGGEQEVTSCLGSFLKLKFSSSPAIICNDARER